MIFFLDPNIPVLTDRGYIPAYGITEKTNLITRSGEHIKVVFSEEVELLDKASRLSWYGSGEPFYIHSSSTLFSRVGILNFYQPDIFTTKDVVCSKFGFPSDSFQIVPFDGIEEAFYALLRMDTRRLRIYYRNRENITDRLGFLLYVAQINKFTKISKFLLGLLKLSDEDKIKLIRELPNVVLKYNEKYIAHFPNIYDAYNFVEFLGRFNLNASIFKFRENKYSVYFDVQRIEKPQPRRYFKKVSSNFSSICSRRWIAVSINANPILMVAGIPMRVCS